MATEVVELTGDEAGLLRALDNAIKKEQQHEDQLARTGAAGAAAGEQIEGALGEVEGALGGVTGAAKEAGDELAGVGKKGSQSNDKALKGLLGDLRKLGPEGRAVGNALKGHFTEAGKAGFQSLDQIIDQLRKIDPEAAAVAESMKADLEAAAKQAGDEVQKIPNKGEKSFSQFSSKAVTQVASIAGAYVGVQEAIQLVVELNQKVIETNREVWESLKQQESGDRRLLQISTSKEDFDSLRERADTVSADFGVDRETAKQLVFSARSEAYEGAIDWIASSQQVVDVPTQAQIAGQIPTLFRSEGLTPQQAINATLAAAENSRLDFAQIGATLPTAAEGASLQGASAAETAGALAAMSSRFKGPEQTADRIKSLAMALNLDKDVVDKDGKVIRESLADIGLIEAVERLKQMSEGDRSAFLGNASEVNTAYSVFVEEMDRIKAYTASSQAAIDNTGTVAAPVEFKRAIADSTATLQTVLAERKSEIALELSREESRAVEVGKRSTRYNRELLAAEERGVNPWVTAAAETYEDLLQKYAGIEMGGNSVPYITDDPLFRLERQSNKLGDTDLSLAATVLREARVDDGDAILSQAATTNYLESVAGERLPEKLVTLEIQQALTAAIDEAAGKALNAFLIPISSPSQIAVDAKPQTESIQAVAREQIELLRRQTTALDRTSQRQVTPEIQRTLTADIDEAAGKTRDALPAETTSTQQPSAERNPAAEALQIVSSEQIEPPRQQAAAPERTSQRQVTPEIQRTLTADIDQAAGKTRGEFPADGSTPQLGPEHKPTAEALEGASNEQIELLRQQVALERTSERKATPEIQRTLTADIDEAAGKNRGDFPADGSNRGLGPERKPTAEALQSASSEQTELLRQQVAASTRTAEAIERQNEINQQQLDAAKTTAANTKPRVADPAAAQRATAELAKQRAANP